MIPQWYDKALQAAALAILTAIAYAWALYWHWWAFFLFWFCLSLLGGIIQLIQQKGFNRKGKHG